MKPFSRQELQSLFDGKKVSSILPYPSLDGSEEVSRLLVEGSGRLSISGAQTKYSMVEDGGVLRFARSGEPGRMLQRELCFFANAYPQVGDLIEASSLSGESRQAYRNAYEYRLSTMQ